MDDENKRIAVIEKDFRIEKTVDYFVEAYSESY